MSSSSPVALVTGAGSGIGRATAIAFARAGAAVVIADIADDGGRETERAIEQAGGDAAFVRTDVSLEADVARMVEKTIERYGRLDWAFNNAGILYQGGFEAPLETYERVMAVNARGVFLCLKHEIAHMKQAGGGAIVNTSSISGIAGSTDAIYGASKYAVIGLTKSAAVLHGPDRIRVNAVCPGLVETAMTAHIIARAAEREDGEPRHRAPQPEQIAGTVVWLCSDAASHITGHALVVDGGATLRAPQ